MKILSEKGILCARTTCFINTISFQYLPTVAPRPFTLVYVKQKNFKLHKTTDIFFRNIFNELWVKPIEKETS